MKSLKCRFIGYVPNSHELWDLENKKVIFSRDVIFDESVMKVDSCKTYKVEEYHFESKKNTDSGEDTHRQNTESGDGDENSVHEEHHSEDSDEEGDLNATLIPDVEQDIEPRRSERIKKTPIWQNDYQVAKLCEALLTDDDGEVDGIPQTIPELKRRDDWNLWEEAINKEMKSMDMNNVWNIVESLPKGRKAISSKWVFVVKRGENGQDRYKARLVAKGCSQKAGIDYKETLSPVVKIATIRTLLSIAVHSNLHIEQMDVKTAFLNGNLGEDVFMKLSFDGTDQKICKLNKSIYGLKQSSRNWNNKFHGAMRSLGFNVATSDPCLYILKKRMLYILLYVDECMIIGRSMEDINWVKQELSKKFDMKDLGKLKDFLGIEINYDKQNGILEISNKAYIEKMLNRFGILDSNGTPMDPGTKLMEAKNETNEPYLELIGSLQYLTLMFRPDIFASLNMLSQFQNKPGKDHFLGLKRILRYLKGTLDYKLRYTKDDDCRLIGFAQNDRKSISGYIFKVFGNTISWSTKKQPTVSLSSTEAELIALCHATKEGLWLSKLMKEIGLGCRPFTIFEDNLPCIRICEEPRDHQRMKHLDVQYLFTRDVIRKKKMVIKHVPSADQTTDMMTKPLNKIVLNIHLRSIRLN
jgi:hypothetical protein